MTTSRKRSPKHLSDTALVLLGKAADSENGMLLPIPKSVKTRGQALAKVLTSLLAQGLIEEVPVKPDEEAWRSDYDGRNGLSITDAECVVTCRRRRTGQRHAHSSRRA
jgi:hypothetical protein